jgi:hypothetical protein
VALAPLFDQHPLKQPLFATAVGPLPDTICGAAPNSRGRRWLPDGCLSLRCLAPFRDAPGSCL